MQDSDNRYVNILPPNTLAKFSKKKRVAFQIPTLLKELPTAKQIGVNRKNKALKCCTFRDPDCCFFEVLFCCNEMAFDIICRTRTSYNWFSVLLLGTVIG